MKKVNAQAQRNTLECGHRTGQFGVDALACPASRKSFLCTLFFCFVLATKIYAGNISGTVRAEGKPAADSGAVGGKYDSRQFKFVERVNYAEMRDFVVYVEGPVGGQPVAPEKPTQIVTRRVQQKGALFSPHVLPVVVGTTVEWPNYDEILHN